MSNKNKGEISFELDGIFYTFALTTSGMMEAEEAFSTPKQEQTWDDLMAKMMRGSAKAFVIFIWAMLRRHHASMTIAETAAFIDRAGGPDGLRMVVEAGQRASTPDPKDVEVLGPPPEAQASRSRGGRSSSKLEPRA